MGDSIRAAVFADFIGRQFPRARTILDVAGGGGALSLWLAALGYDVILIDPRARLSQHRGPNENRSLLSKRIRVMREKFGAHSPQADVIVGMHPDGATVPIVEIADERRCCFAIVPCCITRPAPFELYTRKKNYANFLEVLRHRPKRLDTRMTQLHMAGRNMVIWGWPRALKEETG